MFTSSREVMDDHNRWNGLLNSRQDLAQNAIAKVVSRMKEDAHVQSDPSAINRAITHLNNGVDTPLDYKVAY